MGSEMCIRDRLCRCVFTYHMVCTSTSFTVPSWYRPIGEITPGCLPSAAALPGKAVCSIYHRAAYCLQQRCLVRPCVVFTNSASHPSERWHRGFLAKPSIKSFHCIIAPVCVRWHPSVRWHRGAQKNTKKKYKKNTFAPGSISHMITVPVQTNQSIHARYGSRDCFFPLARRN